MATPTLIKNDLMKISAPDGTSSEIIIDFQKLRKSADVLRAINHKLRRKMMHMLEEAGKMMVTDIYVALRLEQSVASQHLAILRKAGVLKTERQGKFIYYSLNKDRLKDVNNFVEDIVNY